MSILKGILVFFVIAAILVATYYVVRRLKEGAKPMEVINNVKFWLTGKGGNEK